MAIRITKDDVKGLEAIPVGDYECILDKVDMRPSKSSGELCYYIDWAVADGDYDGRVLFDTVSTSPQAFWKLSQLLEATEHDAFGEFLDSGDDEMDIELDEEEILEHLASFSGRVSIRVKHQEYQGDKQARVARVKPSTARAVDQLIEDNDYDSTGDQQIQITEDEIPF